MVFTSVKPATPVLFIAVIIAGLLAGASWWDTQHRGQPASHTNVALNRYTRTQANPNVNAARNDNTNATGDSAADWKTYTNAAYGFSMRYPGDWERQNIESKDRTVTTIQQFYRTITTQTYPDPKQPLDAYVSVYRISNLQKETVQQMLDRKYQDCLKVPDNAFGCPKPADTSGWQSIDMSGRPALHSGKIDALRDYDTTYIPIASSLGDYFIVITATYYNLNITYDFATVIDNMLQSFQFVSPSNVYAISTLAVGDTVAGMTVAAITKPNSWDFTVQFTGQATVQGTYTFYPENSGIINNTVCFVVDQESAAIPKSSADIIRQSFCMDSDFAKAQFGPSGSKGSATITISDYHDRQIGGEVYDSATLVKVVEKTTE